MKITCVSPCLATRIFIFFLSGRVRSWSGKVSIAAHSLGAIICFDIMANQQAAAAADHASPADGRMFGSGESIGEAAGIDVTVRF